MTKFKITVRKSAFMCSGGSMTCLLSVAQTVCTCEQHRDEKTEDCAH